MDPSSEMRIRNAIAGSARLVTIVRAAAGALLLGGCASLVDAPTPITTPRIESGRLIAADGAALGLEIWRPESPKAVVVAVHGMNDYAHAFRFLGEALAKEGVALYAYDQRGFGRSPDFGRWPGAPTMIADLEAAIAAVRDAEPDLPLVVAGHSMGSAVVLAALKKRALDADAVILAAPGVWGASQMPLAYRLSVNVAALFAPSKTLTGERAGRQATDNIPLIREMIKDPLVIKATRIDAVLGVVRLMGEGWDASDEVGGRILVLTGEKDEIIPVATQRRMAGRLCGPVTFKTYKEGWHMIFSDLGAAPVWRDTAAFILEATGREAAGPAVKPGPAASSCSAETGGIEGRRR